MYIIINVCLHSVLTQTQMYTHSIRQQQPTLGQDEGKAPKCPSDPHISLSMKAFTNAAGCEAQPQSRILKT